MISPMSKLCWLIHSDVVFMILRSTEGGFLAGGDDHTSSLNTMSRTVILSLVTFQTIMSLASVRGPSYVDLIPSWIFGAVSKSLKKWYAIANHGFTMLIIFSFPVYSCNDECSNRQCTQIYKFRLPKYFHGPSSLVWYQLKRLVFFYCKLITNSH